MKYWIKIKNQKGQILVEVMVALAMVVIGLLGLLNLLSSSIGMNKVIADQYIASYLASEGIEIIKNIVDNNVADPTNGEGYARGLNPGTSENPSIYEVDYNSQEVSSLSGSLRYLWFDEENSKISISELLGMAVVIEYEEMSLKLVSVSHFIDEKISILFQKLLDTIEA